MNTLFIQEILKDPEWVNKLTENDKRALTPLLHAHINPYGLFFLDMMVRIIIQSPPASNEEQYESDIPESLRQKVC